MISLIDGDLIAFRCAASCEKQGVVTEDFGIACARADNLTHNILAEVEATSHKIYLSGGENYRKKISPSYKANRDEQKRPEYLEPLRAWIASVWNTSITDGIEADDALGIAQTAAEPGTAVICSLDKDLRQIPGKHYSWEIVGTSVSGNQWKKEAQHLVVSEQEGLFNFYWQLVMGDAADNVPGYDGKMRQKVPKFLEQHYDNMIAMETEQELFNYVLELYQLPPHDLVFNGACLWVQRYEGDNWLQKGKQLLEASGMVDSGHLEDLIHSLPPLFEQVPVDGNPNTTP